MSRKCVTHHHGCDCRESAHVAELAAKDAEIERLLKRHMDDVNPMQERIGELLQALRQVDSEARSAISCITGDARVRFVLDIRGTVSRALTPNAGEG